MAESDFLPASVNEFWIALHVAPRLASISSCSTQTLLRTICEFLTVTSISVHPSARTGLSVTFELNGCSRKSSCGLRDKFPRVTGSVWIRSETCESCVQEASPRICWMRVQWTRMWSLPHLRWVMTVLGDATCQTCADAGDVAAGIGEPSTTAQA